MKRNEIRFARSRENNFFFFILFASNISLPIKAKLIERIFSLCFASKNFSFRFFFVLFSLHFIFVSLQMRKQAEKHFFHIEAISLLFRFEAKMMAVFLFRFASFHFEAKMMEVFRFHFASFNFEAKMMEVFRFRFTSFRFEAKMMAVVRFFFVLFSLRSIFVSLQISMFRIEAKTISLPFRFISLRSENDGAPYYRVVVVGKSPRISSGAV